MPYEPQITPLERRELIDSLAEIPSLRLRYLIRGVLSDLSRVEGLLAHAWVKEALNRLEKTAAEASIRRPEPIECYHNWEHAHLHCPHCRERKENKG